MSDSHEDLQIRLKQLEIFLAEEVGFDIEDLNPDLPVTQKAKNESKSFADHSAQLDLKQKQIATDGLEHEHESRKKLSRQIGVFVGAWLAFVALMLIWSAIVRNGLSDQVLMTVVGGASVNIIGLYAIVARYFFHRPGPPP